MRKNIILFILTLFISISFYGQSRGVKIGYIDMEYILQNVPEYIESKNQLEEKAQKWKQEIEAKKNEVVKLKESLKTEKVLLTRELIQEREEEITFQETELLDYQQKRFGPNGDLAIQKAVLAQPIQDQVFTAAQDIAEIKKYDFIFDKSSDLTMLFAAKRYDISDQVVRVITRANKRNQLTKKQLKLEEEKEAKQDMDDDLPGADEKQKNLDNKKAARAKLIEDRKLALEEKKKIAEEKRKEALAEKQALKNGALISKDKNADNNSMQQPTLTQEVTNDETSTEKTSEDQKPEDIKRNTAEERSKILAERKKALEERKKKILEEREALKKAKIEEKTKIN